MNEERILKVILSPIISEKSAFSGGDEQNQYTFKVLPDAHKKEIGVAVEKLFNVKVASVRVLNFKGKIKRSGKHRSTFGKRKDWRKAYVTLHSGYNIELEGAG